MTKENWRGILVQSENCTEIYRRIFEQLGIKDIAEIENGKSPQKEARTVGEIATVTLANNKKPLVIGLGHHLMAYVGDDSVDYVYFDAHSDDHVCAGNNQFSCATFINHMQGRHYVAGVGENIYPNGNRAIWFRHNEAERITEQPFRNRIFLSYDIDVFDKSITAAHGWGISGRMFPEQVKDLSARIVNGRNLVGINVASYKPYKEAEQKYKTVEIIADLLRPLITKEKIGEVS